MKLSKTIKLNKEQSKIIIEELTNPPELTDEKRAFIEECVRISKLNKEKQTEITEEKETFLESCIRVYKEEREKSNERN